MVYARIDEPHAELVQLPGTRLTKQPLLQLAGGFLGSAEAKATLQSCCMHTCMQCTNADRVSRRSRVGDRQLLAIGKVALG